MKSCSYARCWRLIAILGSADGSLLSGVSELHVSVMVTSRLRTFPPFYRCADDTQLQQQSRKRSQSRVLVPTTRGRRRAFASLFCYSLLSLLLYISWCLHFTAPKRITILTVLKPIKLNFMTSKVRISSSSRQMDINNHGHV